MCGLVLLVFGLLIVRAALLPTPNLDELQHWRGTVESVAMETLRSGKDSQDMLRIGLDEPARMFFVHNQSAELKELQERLPIGTAIEAWVEPHARQVLAGTPFAQGHTEAWQLTVTDVADSESNWGAKSLVKYADSVARRRRDRAGWGFAGGAAVLVGLFGLFGTIRGSKQSPPVSG